MSTASTWWATPGFSNMFRGRAPWPLVLQLPNWAARPSPRVNILCCNDISATQADSECCSNILSFHLICWYGKKWRTLKFLHARNMTFHSEDLQVREFLLKLQKCRIKFRSVQVKERKLDHDGNMSPSVSRPRVSRHARGVHVMLIHAINDPWFVIIYNHHRCILK